MAREDALRVSSPVKFWVVLLLLLMLDTAPFAQTRMVEQFSAPTRFLVAHGRRAWVGGYANGGLEVWVGALQIANDVRPEFRRAGDETPIPGALILSRIDVEPSHVARTYTGPDFSATEEVWVPLDQPGALIQYTIRSARPVETVVRFRPSLNLMWPAALGAQEINWNVAQSGYTLMDSARQFAAVVLAPGATRHDEPVNSARPIPQNDELAVTFEAPSAQILFHAIKPSPLNKPVADAEFTAARQLLQSSEWQAASRKHYEDVLSSGLRIETPSAEVNRALAWAKIALDQAWFCNTALGCGYVAGFGPSRRNRRPQYAWFFAGDGMINAQAALATGDLDHAREEIRFVAKYQDAQTGMIWHELSQSAPYVDWRGRYPYMFGHADTTYPYFSIVDDYFRASNDRAFLTEIWPSVEKAFAYGRSLIGADGLPRIPVGKEGIDEQHELSDELGTSAAWIVACEDFSHLAELMGRQQLSHEARELAEKARATFAQRYWDAKRGFAVQGYQRNGEAMQDRGLAGIAAIPERLFGDKQRTQILDAIASWRFQTDWGTRSVAFGEAGFDPTGYAHGSVWALSTADVAQAYWTEHRSATAWQVWSTLVPWSSLDSPGHMHEVLAGDTYHPQLESVPEQTWSSAAFLSSAVRGLLGIDVDARDRTLTFAPHLPTSWDHTDLRGVQVADSRVNLSFQQDISGMKLHIENSGETLQMRFHPQIPQGSQSVTATLDGRKIAVRSESHPQDEDAVVEFAAPHGPSELLIGYQGGVALIMPEHRPSLGEPSTGMRVTAINLVGNVLRLGLDLAPRTENRLQVQTERTIRDANSATFRRVSSGLYELSITPVTAEPGSFQHREVVVTFDK